MHIAWERGYTILSWCEKNLGVWCACREHLCPVNQKLFRHARLQGRDARLQGRHARLQGRHVRLQGRLYLTVENPWLELGETYLSSR